MAKRAPKIRWPWVSTGLVVFCLINWGWSAFGYWRVDPQVWKGGSNYISIAPADLASRRGWGLHSRRSQVAFYVSWREAVEMEVTRGEDDRATEFAGWLVSSTLTLGVATNDRITAKNIFSGYRDAADNLKRQVERGHGFGLLGIDAAWEPASPEAKSDLTRGIAIHWLWFVFAATLLAVVRWRRYIVLRRRRSRGCCIACGYDLRAATGDVCSECGVARASA